jgi:hypothetical protein
MSLIPPDLTRCQVEVPNGHSFMTLGGRPGRERCKKKPMFLVTEQLYGADGQRGAMTMCPDCFLVFLKDHDIIEYDVTTLMEGWQV